MFEIYIIQDLQGNWIGADRMYQVLQEESGQEEIILVDTDAINQEFIETVTLESTPGIVFIKSLSKNKHVVVDRITNPVNLEDLRKRYRAATNSPIVFGDSSGVPLGDIIDFNSKTGNDKENDPFGLGIFNFNINLPSWGWFLIAGLAGYRALSRKSGRHLYLAASAATFYAAYKKFTDEK